MNINELDSYDLDAAVKFNNELNPRLWNQDETLRPEVREQLLRIANDFAEFLGVTDFELKDITISGSNAAYTYTPHSDIDLHLVVDLPKADASEVYRELFDAKKYQYNDQHNITIGGYDVELYVQNANQPHISQGIYSVLQDKWLQVPRRRQPTVDDISTRSKYETLSQQIEQAIDSADYDKITALTDKIKKMRQTGLTQHGEFGPENLTFKMLRSQGQIEKLYQAKNSAKDQLLSLDERGRKKKRASKKRWGYFGGYWYPGTGYAGQDTPAAQEAGDGGGDGGGESIKESQQINVDEQILQDFIKFCVAELKIKHMPRVKLRRDPQWPTVHRTFGRYNDQDKILEVAWGNRHIMDVLRTVAHELTHTRQHEREDVPPSAGETGSEYENEANARAGVLMRDWARLHPEHFEAGQAQSLSELAVTETAPIGFVVPGMSNDPVKAWKRQVRDLILQYREDPTRLGDLAKEKGPGSAEAVAYAYMRNPTARIPLPPGADVKESASGYIPTKKQAKDPRFSMALTVDIRPGQVGKEANKLKLKTDRQGHPQIANPNGLFEDLYLEYKKYKADEDYSPDAPPGPEFRPTMPAGTLRVDVSDVYDWYKLGQHISNMKGLGKHDFGKGPPSSIISFGDEDTEHKFIKDLEATGLDVTDIDPVDPRQPPGKKIKTDPTYNVNEVSDDRLQTYLYQAGQQVDRRQERMAQARERLNKGYEIYHAEDPTFIVHRFEANTPADARRYYETFIDRYESDRDFDLQLRRSTGLMETAQSESEQHHGWRAELVDEITPTTFEVQLTNRRSQETANFVVRPVDMIRPGLAGKLTIDSMDIRDLQTGATRSIQSDSDEPWVYILDAVSALFWDTPALQQKLQAQIKAHQDQGLPMLPGLKQRRSAGQGMPVRDFVKGQQAAQDAMARAQGKKDITEDEDLDEVKMSPGALEKFATSPAAKGIRAGFEAELIFRDTQGESDEMDPEPNYDADERAYSIAQVIEFFTMDEYGYGLSDRERNRLEENLDEAYMQWRDEQIISDFRNDAEDLIREKLLDETPLSERIHLYLTDSEQMSDKEADRIIAAGVDAPKFTTSKEQQAYAAENPYYQAYLDAADAAELELDESVEYSVSQQDGYWDEALDDYRNDWSGDDDSFFSDIGLRWMSDIANEYGLDWPVWNMDSGRNNGSRSWEDIGSELQAVVDMPVVVSDNYHSTSRRPGQWIIEPDGSLHADDQSEEAGLEIVSPPMPLLTAIEKLRQVTDWANDPRGGNAYTNGTTGLHMGVSLPTMKSEDATDDTGIDYVKLILFMGDKYVQQQFGREANNFCASALDKFRQNIKGKRSDPAGVVELLRHGLTELAYRELQKGVGTSKYTSAHIQNGYIEFRSPGGDWLAKADEEIGILENTMLRFARAMAIAGDPSAERQEYAKKLYKLVTVDNPEYADQLKLFSEFSAGTINKEQLKKQWADTVLQKELPSVGKEEYEVFRQDNKDSPDATVGTLYAKNYDDAYDQFMKQYGQDVNTSAYLDVRIKQPWFDVFDETGKIVKTIRAKDVDTATDRAQYEFGQRWTDAWKIYRRPDDTPEPKASPRAQVAKRIATKKIDYNYDIVSRNSNKVIDRFYAETPQEAEQTYSAWLKQNTLPDDSEDYGYRKTEQAADNQRDSADIQRRLGVQDIDTDVAQNFGQSQDATQRSGSWSIYDVTLGREITRMDNVPWQQANDRANELEQSTGHNMSVRGLSENRSAISQAIKNIEENFADGKVKGKSRPGRVKRAGASCNGSVTDLRRRAKNASGEKAKMYHWCANMKSGKKK